MIDADLYNKSGYQLMPVHLTLPASQEEEAESKALACVKDLNECGLRLHWPEELQCIGEHFDAVKRDNTFWEKLNYFAYRLSQLSYHERTVLNGIWAIHRPEDMERAIDLTYHCRNIVVAKDIDSDADLGRFLVEDGFVLCPKHLVPLLDYTAVGREHRERHFCSLVEGVYYEDLFPAVKRVYKGQRVPEDFDWQSRRSRLVEGELIAEVQLWHEAGEQTCTTVYLPVEDAVLEKLREEYSGEDAGMKVTWKNSLWALALISDGDVAPDCLSKLNELAERIHMLPEEKRIQLCTLADIYMRREMGLKPSLACAIALTSVLSDNTEVLSGVSNYEKLGRDCFRHRMLLSADCDLYEHLDFERIGREYCTEAGGHFYGGHFIRRLPSLEQLQTSMTEMEQALLEPEFGGLS